MELVIKNAFLEGREGTYNIGIHQGMIVSIDESQIPAAEHEIDADGGMVSPAFIDPHFHLENALLWNRAVNKSGTLREAIELYADIKKNMAQDDIIARASDALRMAIENGTLWLRNHVDIDQVGQLNLLDAILAVRERFTERINIQIVAFPQLGLAKNPEAVDLMWKAMARGADVVGGMPHGEKDMKDAARHIEIAFDIAQKYNADVDMHVDETDDPYWMTLELLADKTIETGWQGRVSAGHCCAMAAWEDAVAERVIEKVKKARINIIANAPVNLLLQGRKDPYPKRRGITRVKQLLEAGVNVTCGQDDLENMFYPYGNMDMLEVAMILGHAAHLSAPNEIKAAFDMPRTNAARVLRLDDYGVEPGSRANLVILDARTPLEALRKRPERRFVIREGKVLLEQSMNRIWYVND